MDNELKSRIKKKRAELGLSQTDVANQVGVSPQSVNQWERGVTTPRGHRLDKLAKALETDSQWLMFGVTNNVQSENVQIKASNLFDSESKLSSTDLGEIQPTTFIDIPVYDINFAAGEGSFTDCAEILFHYPIPTLMLEKHRIHSTDVLIARVSGDSMEPTLNNGDLVLINTSVKKALSNKILAFVFDDSLRVKRFFHKLDRSWVIMSDNEDKNRYADESVSQLSVNHLQIIGQVINIVDRSLA
jgi:phage repressor protein C with HTH and peptisase S24 domain